MTNNIIITIIVCTGVHLSVSMCDPRTTCQCCRAQKQGGCGARAGEAEGWHSQSIIRIRREVRGGEGPNGQGWPIVLFDTESVAISSSHLLPDLIYFILFVYKCISTVQVALGHDYVAQVEQHSSQKDAAQGFGGKFGVQKDRVDKVRRGIPLVLSPTPFL